MIPFRDTIGDPGPVRGTLVLLVLEAAAWALGLFEGSIWVLLLALAGTWLFGSPLERRLDTARFTAVVVALILVSGLIAALIDGDGVFVLCPLGAVLGLGLVLVATIPRARILVLGPIPFAAGLYEVPAWIVLGIWTVLAWLAA